MRAASSGFRKVFLLILILLWGGSCVTAPQHTKVISKEEGKKQKHARSNELALDFEAQLKFKKNTEVSLYLKKIAENLVASTPELQGTSVGIWLIQERNGKWQSFGLPGNRIYLPTGLLRNLNFENEVAAAIALQLSHILKRDVQNRIQEIAENSKQDLTKMDSEKVSSSTLAGLVPDMEGTEKKVDYFGLNGIFSFTDEAEIASAKDAVGILYRAGYDARGLISLCQVYQNNPEHSPHEKDTVSKLLEQARQEIAHFPPLRNPVVRSQSFVLIQKRIRQL
jgi:predicted Zn-dependent protease